MTDTLPNRRSIRLPMYDYTSCGGYFITICTQNQQCVFGNIVDGQMVLNDAGRIVAEEWETTSQIRDNIKLDQWVVMPNHFHGILFISNSGTVAAGTARRAPTKKPCASITTGLLKLHRSLRNSSRWQRSFKMKWRVKNNLDSLLTR